MRVQSSAPGATAISAHCAPRRSPGAYSLALQRETAVQRATTAGFVDARANVGLRPGPRLTVLGMGGYGAVPNVCCGVPDAVTVANEVEVDVELRAAWDFVRAPRRLVWARHRLQ